MQNRIAPHTFGFLMLAFALLLTGCTDSTMHEPIDNAAHRARPLHFGLYVTPNPEENPIDPPERFIGYHVGTDFEVSTDELEKDVPIYAICSGRIVYSGFAGGYGGLIVQRCKIDGETSTVLYGHLTVSSLVDEGINVRAGEKIAVLAPARSYDSDGNRKHLHLGIHRGTVLDLRGYVQTEEETQEYVDAADVLPSEIIDLPISNGGEVPYWEKDQGSSSSGLANW